MGVSLNLPEGFTVIPRSSAQALTLLSQWALPRPTLVTTEHMGEHQDCACMPRGILEQDVGAAGSPWAGSASVLPGG